MICLVGCSAVIVWLWFVTGGFCLVALLNLVVCLVILYFCANLFVGFILGLFCLFGFGCLGLLWLC